MAHTQLAQKIIDLALEMQEEAKAEICSPKFYYLAIRRILDNKELISGIEVDENELEGLSKLVNSEELISVKQVEKEIELKKYSEDADSARNIKRWLSVGSRSAVDVWKKIADYFYENKETEEEPSDVDASENKEDEADTVETACEGKNEEKTVTKEDTSLAGLVNNAASLKKEILKVVKGQDYAVNRFVDTFFRGEFLAETDDKKRGPRCLFTFLGMPGVGKTLLAQTAAEVIGRPCLKVDMSNAAALEIIANRPDCFKKKEPSTFADFVDKIPECILLIDELEKAPVQVLLRFLAMIDSGISSGVDYRNAIIIFTTNAGKNLYSMSEYGRLSNIPDAIIKDALMKDIDPITGKPFFPPEFVSRLASGTLIMFDKLAAADLINMTSSEIDRHIANTEDKYGIKINRDDSVAATVLFSLGGNIDGRNAITKGKTFFTKELYELLSLANADRGSDATASIRTLNIKVDEKNAPDEVKRLYKDDENIEILILANEDVKKVIEKETYECTVKCTSDLSDYLNIISKDDVTISLIDYKFGTKTCDDMLNVEDILSDGRTAFEKTVSEYNDTVTYVYSYEKQEHNKEEIASLINKGAEDAIVLPEDTKAFITELCRRVCLKNALETLSLRHKVLSYNSIQKMSGDNSSATLTLYNLKLEDSIEAEDRGVIMSDDEVPNMTWDDVVIDERVKMELEEYVGYLKNPKKFMAKGRRAPKGLIFYGPPGTGKTSIAKVLASISGVRFIATAGANFESKWAGHTTENVRRVFAQARKNAPAILFIDEIDAIGGKRTDASEDTGGAVKDQNSVVTALLNEMDGFKTSPKKPVLVVAATNVLSSLDPALLRRFEKQTLLDNPNREGREKIIRNLCRKHSEMMKVSDECILNLATRMIGLSPAKIEAVVNEAIAMAIRNDTVVTDDIFDEAFEYESYKGERKHTKEEQLQTARHEVGHAYISSYYGEVPDYLTIVSRGNHGGYSMTVGDEEKGKYTKPELLHIICRAVAGKAAEAVYYGDADGVTTGPSSDLEKATSIARQMVCVYGMSEKVGLISTGAIKGSKELDSIIIEEVKCILDEQYSLAKKIIVENKEVFDRLVDALFEKQHMTKEEIEEVINKK